MRDLVRLMSFLLRLSRQVRRSRRTTVVIVGAGIASGLASTVLLALVNSLLHPGPTVARTTVWLFVALCLLMPALRLLAQVRLLDLGQDTMLALRLQLTRQILAAPLRHLETLGTARLLASLTNDITLVVDSLHIIPMLLVNFAILAGCLIYLGWLSGPLLLEIGVCIALGALTYQLPLRRAFRYFERSRTRLDEVVRQIRALIEGTKELKMHRGRRGAFLRAVEASTREFQRDNRRGGVIYAVALAWGQTLFFVVIGVLIVVLPRFQPIPARVLIGCVLILFQVMVPIEVLLNSLPVLSRAAVAVRKLEELGSALQSSQAPLAAHVAPAPSPPAIAPGSLADAPPRAEQDGWGWLELRGVTHSYRRENEDERFQLGPIDLTVAPGQLVFIVGGNGSGKTTLAKLLIGLYAPESGEIRFGGAAIGDGDRESYRENFAVVFADFFVFEELLGLQAPALDAEAGRYLARLHLERKVRVEGGVLSTTELSQGQRKRLALLTAYLEDRPLYLFDEWAADQDPQFKEIFYLELLPELKARRKTVFVITHDDRYFHVADRIVKLDYGRIEYDLPPAPPAISRSPLPLLV
ncbi:MAG TPA: cyclic peptide export ABC transporter [Thermoanaerobaculia bacterium]|nr:cyclic peptide export ABC transporter [Thermoanaerobaculia bacterium]